MSYSSSTSGDEHGSGSEWSDCVHTALSSCRPCSTHVTRVIILSENVPMKLMEDSDECDDRTDDHRNV